MYKEIHLINDMMKEKYLYGAELVGKYGFPKLDPCSIFLPDEAISFNMAKSERNPKKKMCHFFTDDYQFQRLWNDADKYMDILKNFGAVCSPDEEWG